MDLYLKFTDEAEAKSVLYRIEGAVEADPEMGIEAQEGYEVANYRNIDTIGVMYTGGEWDAEGNVVTPPTELAGWHVNVRLVGDESDETLLPFVVTPLTPQRVWA